MQPEPADNNLLELIYQSFNREELKNLSFDLGFDYDNLPTGLSKKGEIRELVLEFTRHHRLPLLITSLEKERPQRPWPRPDNILFQASLDQSSLPQPFEPEMKTVENGPFLMGSLLGDGVSKHETPQHSVELLDYKISRYPITMAQYAVFLKEANHLAPKGWLGITPIAGKDNYPVVNVTFFDAIGYCDWLSNRTKRPYRLPTEAEWEKAARGKNGNLYPWGNSWVEGRCNNSSSNTTPVDAFPSGASIYGCEDMVGNVREWTQTLWGDDLEHPQYAYPYQIDDGRENDPTSQNSCRIIRSSSFNDRPDRHRCTNRTWYVPSNANRRRGFRVAISNMLNTWGK